MLRVAAISGLLATSMWAKGLTDLKNSVELSYQGHFLDWGESELVFGLTVTLDNPSRGTVRITQPDITISLEGRQLTKSPSASGTAPIRIAPRSTTSLPMLVFPISFDRLGQEIYALVSTLLAGAFRPLLQVRVETTISVGPVSKKYDETHTIPFNA